MLKFVFQRTVIGRPEPKLKNRQDSQNNTLSGAIPWDSQIAPDIRRIFFGQRTPTQLRETRPTLTPLCDFPCAESTCCDSCPEFLDNLRRSPYRGQATSRDPRPVAGSLKQGNAEGAISEGRRNCRARGNKMPKRRDLIERISPDDPNYDLAKRFYHEAWSDSHGLNAEGLAGRASLGDFVDTNVRTFERATKTLSAIRDDATVPTKCRAVDDLANGYIRLTTAALAREAKRFGRAKTTAASNDHARRVLEIAARCKQRLHARALKEMGGLKQKRQPGKAQSSGEKPQAQAAAHPLRPRRTPDIKTSRERIDLVNGLASELALVKQETKAYCTLEMLKRKYPKFRLWTHVQDSQIKELIDGEAFAPKAYAENIVLTKYGFTSRETLKKDRRKLRKFESERTQ